MENSKSPSDTASQQTKAARDWHRVLLWVVSIAFFILGTGLAKTAADDKWWNEVVAGLLTMAGALMLLPPILDQARSRWPVLRPKWAAVAFAISLLFVPSLLGRPFAPGPAERDTLRLDAIHDANALLKAGRPFEAKLALRRFANEANPDHRVADLMAKIAATTKARSQQAGTSARGSAKAGQKAQRPYVAPDPAKDYVERVQTYWLPETVSLPTKAPMGGSEYGALQSKLETLRSYVADGEALRLSVEQRSVHLRFKQALAAKQTALYPSLREHYAVALRAGLFRDDVDVAAIGPRASTLRLTGGVFARNANIQDMQRSLGSAVEKMRFKTVEYRWSRYVGGGYRYQMDVKQDGDVID